MAAPARDSADVGSQAGNMITKGAAKLHGLGEAIRGNVNAFADSAVHTDPSRSQAVAARGEREFDTGHFEGRRAAGVTPVDTERDRVEREVAGEGNKIAHADGTGKGQRVADVRTAGAVTAGLGTSSADRV